MKSSYKIALCGIAAAFGAIFLSLVRVMPSGKLALFGLASVSVMLPLSQKMWGGAALTVLASALIGFFFGGIAAALAHVFIFGAHPFFIALLDKPVRRPAVGGHVPAGQDAPPRVPLARRAVSLAVKLIYFNIAVALLYNIAVLVFFPDITAEYWLVALLVSLAFIVYDFVMQQLFLQLRKWVAKFVS